MHMAVKRCQTRGRLKKWLAISLDMFAIVAPNLLSGMVPSIKSAWGAKADAPIKT
jgi:hypothetical protein